MRSLVDQYLDEIEVLLEKVHTDQKLTIKKAGKTIADSIENGGVLHVFGSGHSHMIAEDIFHRAGGLVCVNAMLEESLMELNSGRSMQLERLTGYANVLLQGYDLREGEVIVIISNSGINSVPIEMAMECKKRGLYVIALTNKDHTSQVDSRHSSGQKLHEIADLVLDNYGVYGDATLSLEQSSKKIGPTSTIGGLVVIQSLMVAIVEELMDRKLTLPILESANTKSEGDSNHELISQYHKRIRYLTKPL